MIPCDGCQREFATIGLVASMGHVMRYCSDCMDQWATFKAACEAEGQRLNRVLDLWELDLRSRVPLKLTPLDLPRVMTDAKGEAIVLG